MSRGTGRQQRLALLDRLTADDPGLREQLLALRHHNPQAYRRKLHALDQAMQSWAAGESTPH